MAARYDGKPVHAAGSIDHFGAFAGGDPSPITLAVDAPAYLPARATLSGTAAYHADTFSLSQFSAASGADSAAGNVLYQDDTLKLDINARYRGKPVIFLYAVEHVARALGRHLDRYHHPQTKIDCLQTIEPNYHQY